MLKFMKHGVIGSIIILSGSMLNIQANCVCPEPHAVIASSNITYQEETTYPQTIIYTIVSEFLQDKTKDKTKKVLVLGYDGFRADALENVFTNAPSGIQTISNEGGLYHSYAGADGKQETSTAPGWLSILSGQWAYTLGVVDNEDVKEKGGTTFLQDATTLGYASTFLSSWSTHFDTTYREDILHPENEVIYQQTNSDEQTIAVLQQELSDTSSSAKDVFFAILESTDHAGHELGYGNQSAEYKQASIQVDQIGYQLLQAITRRTCYDQEDWLIIITTDHGGTGRIHGGQSAVEQNTWFAVNKELP